MKSLPKTLDETYDRILRNIDEDYRQDALRILQWLAYSARPLQIEEVAEIVAVDAEQSRFDPENRLRDPRDVLTICSSLVTTAAITAPRAASGEITELRLAHFSVKEYLTSDRIRRGLDFQYDIQSSAEEEITQTCLAYLLHFERGVLTSTSLHIFPLARYAARYWCHHFRAIKNLDPATKLSMQLFEGNAFKSWIRLFDPETPWTYPDSIKRDISTAASPLYYASREGLFQPLTLLLLETGADVNAQGGYYGNALQVASYGGHEAIAALLLEKGADVNAQGGWYGNALQAASAKGHEAIVALLLEKGADVNAQGGEHNKALEAALRRDHEGNVALLLEKGADGSPQGGWYGNALQAASARGHRAVVALLLEKGADVNAQGGYYANSLEAASAEGYEAIVVLLLEKGADVNAQGGYYANSLEAASARGYEAIVTLLAKKKNELTD